MKPTDDFGNGNTATKKFIGSNVEDLPVIELQGGHVSCWELTDEDIELLLKHRRLYLWVAGPVHPPVAFILKPLPAPLGAQTAPAPASRDGERKIDA